MGQQLETMLRRCAALCTSAGIKSAELGFRLMHSQIPASGAELKLKQLRGRAQRSLVSCCICSKHGFQNLPPQTPKSWYAHQGKTMLRTYAAPGPPAGIRSAELEFATSTALYTP